MRLHTIIESAGFVFRIDPHQISDFSKSPKTYYFTDAGSGQVDNTAQPPEWAKGAQGQFRTGLFAGPFDQIISYLIPRHIPWLVAHTQPKRTLYYNQEDTGEMQSYAPVISSFRTDQFEQIGKDGQAEYFSDKPPIPSKQSVIKNPLRILQNHFELAPVPNLQALEETFDKLRAANIGVDAENIDF